MNVYQCRYCFRIISNDLCIVEGDSNGIVVTGVEDSISLISSKDPAVKYLRCACKNKVGEVHGKGTDKNPLIYRLKNDSIIRFPIKKLVGHIRSEECESDSENVVNGKIINTNNNRNINILAAKVEELERELTSVKKEHSEKLESLCGMMGDSMASLTRMAELVCELNPDIDLRSAFQHIF